MSLVGAIIIRGVSYVVKYITVHNVIEMESNFGVGRTYARYSKHYTLIILFIHITCTLVEVCYMCSHSSPGAN